ncbi:MAG TPA: LacI family DNA-binding transcriptional regulator [Dehalococcoidia bacterium]|nr:LacI family DNA-binding transcriptional regulator [Dehalococcoidia bacterium]
MAKAAGVSPMTVSHVINEHRHVKKSTRARVLTTMDELGYRVNVAARNLRTGRTGTIGFAVPEVDRPYWGQLSAAVIAAADRHGLRVVIEQTGRRRDNELNALSMSRNRLYDGLILSTVGLGPADGELLKVDYPVVILGERIFDGPLDHVAMPNVQAARAATAHLIERGCRRVAITEGSITGEVDVSSLRFEGYRQALHGANLPFSSDLVVNLDLLDMQSGADAVRGLVARGVQFDGVFCVTDTTAIGVLRGLADLGLDVPGQVKVIGFDNVAESAFTVPSLSSVDPGLETIAKKAVDLLAGKISGAVASDAHEELVTDYSIVARESTAS